MELLPHTQLQREGWRVTAFSTGGETNWLGVKEGGLQSWGVATSLDWGLRSTQADGALTSWAASLAPGGRAGRGETGGLRHGTPLPAVISRLEPAAPALAG